MIRALVGLGCIIVGAGFVEVSGNFAVGVPLCALGAIIMLWGYSGMNEENLGQGMIQHKVEKINQRIALAHSASERAKSDWGKNYWSVVLAYLLRQANRLN